MPRRSATFAAKTITRIQGGTFLQARCVAQFRFQALIHLLRSEGVELGNEPVPPVDRSKKPKGFVKKNIAEDEDWIEYR